MAVLFFQVSLFGMSWVSFCSASVPTPFTPKHGKQSKLMHLWAKLILLCSTHKPLFAQMFRCCVFPCNKLHNLFLRSLKRWDLQWKHMERKLRVAGGDMLGTVEQRTFHSFDLSWHYLFLANMHVLRRERDLDMNLVALPSNMTFYCPMFWLFNLPFSHQEYVVEGANYMRVKFYISGNKRKGTVHVDAKEVMNILRIFRPDWHTPSVI